ncbi:hypothetical protein MMC18_007960 [Xylographa bjoerkii]|nr:hypothetical protein [Xylographa bjoerkii]
MSFWTKLKWSAALYCSPRGIGWNYQVKGVPAYEAPRTKANFLLNQATWLAVIWLAIDALQVYHVEVFYGGQPDIMTMPFIGTGGQHLGQRALNGVTTTLTAVYLPVQNAYTVIAMFSVLLGGSAPKDWPPIYGSNLMEMTTLRKFWNTFWHQVIRKTFLDWSHHFCNMLGIKRGTWLSTYFLLYFAFFMTAVGHGLGTYVIPHGPNATFDDRFYAWVRFFMRHAVAIHFEDFVIWCYKQVAYPGATTSNGEGQPDNRDTVSKRWHRVVGRVWVAGWWLYAMDWAMQAVLHTGVLADSPLPFSVWGPLLRAFGVV